MTAKLTTDVILPILNNIQGDMASMKGDMAMRGRKLFAELTKDWSDQRQKKVEAKSKKLSTIPAHDGFEKTMTKEQISASDKRVEKLIANFPGLGDQ